VLGSLFGKKPARGRPELAAWIADASPALVVDGGAWAATFSGARALRHETSGAPGLPFFDRDPRRLPAKDAEFAAVVLGDVLDEVIDVGFAVDEARRVLAPGGRLLIVQRVAPDDFEQRAVWNAVAVMRDARHTWTPSARQLAAIVSGVKMTLEREAEWEEDVDLLETTRPDMAARLALMRDAAAARGATDVVRDGRLVVARRAVLLRSV
jgi:SAM-dependent methyltransferase